MIRTSPESDRRILTFPAIQPCESISRVTLLNSLIQLAREILSFKSRPISTNKRNARGTFRLVHDLLVFLDDIRIHNGSEDLLLPDSAVLSLSELHLIFQKLKYLLEDCTRDGSRLWMLMNSDLVADHFRVLTRSISTSLDIFPLRSVDLPGEVHELVDLVVRQTRKASIGCDQDDKRVVNSMYRILGEFETGFVPDQNEIIRVVDHIGVRKWSDCNKEIGFLETEIETESFKEEEKKQKKKKSESELLSSLMGFMSYCRCVIFRFIDAKSYHCIHKNNNGDGNLLRGINTDDLRCPISLEIMKDPVTLATGHTYDRSSILKWFRSGNPICPKTGERLINTELVSNTVIKRMIGHYCALAQKGAVWRESGHKRSRDLPRTAEPGSPAAEGAVKLLARFLAGELVSDGVEEIYKASYEVRVLTKTSFFNRSCLVEAGVVGLLLKLLGSKDTKTQENAMAALLNLSKHKGGKAEIVENGGLGFIVEVLNKGIRREAKQHAAATLFYLASVEDYSRLIGENPDAIPGLMELIKGNSDNDFAKRNALTAIMGLLMNPDNHWRVLAVGAIPLLLDLLKSEERGELIADSLAILAKLAENPDGTISVIRRGGLKLAVKILGSPDIPPAEKQHCVALLLNLCTNGGGDVVASLVKSPSLMGSLYSVVSGGSGGNKKASALIRILHEFQERKPGSGSIIPVLLRERFVHAW